MLRRLKADVETQLPSKTEHVVYCDLSRRQRFLYDEFMSRTKTKETLAAGNYMHIINILMQLRKVCNHPNLFAEPEIESPLVLEPLCVRTPSLVYTSFEASPDFGTVLDFARRPAVSLDLCFVGLCLLHNEMQDGRGPTGRRMDHSSLCALPSPVGFVSPLATEPVSAATGMYPLLAQLRAELEHAQRVKLTHHAYVNSMRSGRTIIYGHRLRAAVSVVSSLDDLIDGLPSEVLGSALNCVATAVHDADFDKFVMLTPRVLVPPPVHAVSSPCPWSARQRMAAAFESLPKLKPLLPPTQPASVALNSLGFPDPRLIQVNKKKNKKKKKKKKKKISLVSIINQKAPKKKKQKETSR